MSALDSSLVSDLYKDVHGYRPGDDFWSVWKRQTNAEKQKEYDLLCRMLEEEFAQEVREAEENAVAFEQLVSETIARGAGDRDTAIRWLLDATGRPADWIDFCYEHGLPNHYFSKK